MPTIPRHVAIIMDGNGRWAEARGLPRTEGHRQGVEALRRTVGGAIELGVTHLTLFSFSSENWSRPEREVSDLMGLLKYFVRRDLAELDREGVRILTIGERTGLDPEIAGLLDEAETKTRSNLRFTLVMAFNYGARAELVRAAARLAREVRAGRLEPEGIDVALMAAALDTGGLPDPDLLIRTGGERRLSNFLLWQLAYAELVFMDVFWPEFDKDRLGEAVAEFQRRDRRFGGLSQRTAK